MSTDKFIIIFFFLKKERKFHSLPKCKRFCGYNLEVQKFAILVYDDSNTS
jgi:hypothetical protein